jgi:hypothetical protein
MIIRAGYNIAFEVAQLTPIILMVSVHPSRARDLLTSPKILSSPDLSMRDYQDTFGNICTRVTAPPGLVEFSSSFDIRDSGCPDEVSMNARRHPIDELPDETLLYLLDDRFHGSCRNEGIHLVFLTPI